MAMHERLLSSLRDEDPYVRKTAALLVNKLCSVQPGLLERLEFVTALKSLLSDSNPMVVVNSLTALVNLKEHTKQNLLVFDSGIVRKLLIVMNECTEWGQIFILDTVCSYEPTSSEEAQSICERIIHRLSHSNCAVVLSTVKVLLKMSNYIDDKKAVKALEKKLGPSLSTFISLY
ncbi:AP-1 complex subunit beta-like [Zophobas morio]|uniref:AP-1 complex subunit beta-like n=1 Tax=Zophobas morio TaxID=2755281 RepID=UPI0030836D48